jgi:hypothetical protein
VIKKARVEKAKAYPDIDSVNTSAALTKNTIIMKNALATKDGRRMFKNMEIPEEFNPSRQFTMREMVIMEIAMNGKFCIVTMCLKDQRDYAQRAFFVQMVYNRNANILWDNLGRPLLLHSSNPSDLILTPGMMKYVTMQERMKGFKYDDMSVAGDQTKYGDTYSVGAMQVQLIAWRDEGYISDKEFNLCFYFSQMLQKRIVLMPQEQYKAHMELKKKMDVVDEEDWVYIKGHQYVVEIRNKYSSVLGGEKKNEILAEDNMFNGLHQYIGFVRSSGGTLGVFNVLWSCFSSNITMLEKLVLDKVFLEGGKIMVSATHSDDLKRHFKGPVPPPNAFEENVLDKLINLVMTDGEFNGTKLLVAPGRNLLVVKPDNTRFESDLPSWAASKFYLCLMFLTPRMFSQRPSFLKYVVGSAAEMLQVVTTSDGKTYEPLIRYSSTIAAEMSGFSPASDTMGAVGRVYSMLVNGAPATVITAMMIMINMAVGKRFGLANEFRDKFAPLELGGIWWSTPDLILLSGFKANLGRIVTMAESRHPDADYYKRLIQIMMNSSKVWKTKRPEVLAENGELTELVANATDDIDSMELMTSAPETFKDFFIRWSRSKRLQIDFESMLAACGPFLRSSRKDLYNNVITDKDLFKEIKDAMGLARMVRTDAFVPALINQLDRYTKPSAPSSAARVSPDSVWIGRFGYFKRIVDNPFGEDVTRYLQSRGRLDINSQIDRDKKKIKFPLIQLVDVYRCVYELAKDSGFQIPMFHLKAYTLLKESVSDIRRHLQGPVGEVNIKDRLIEYEDEPMKYYKITRPAILRYNTKNLLYSLIYWWDVFDKADRIDADRWIYKLMPSLLNDAEFKEQITTTKGILDNLQIRSKKAVDRHAKLIINLHSPNLFEGVAKLSSEPDDEMAYAFRYLAVSYSWDEKLEITNTIYIPTITEESERDVFIKKHSEIILKNLERPLLMMMWKTELSPFKPMITPSNVTMTFNGVKMLIDIERMLIDMLKPQTYIFDAENASRLFTGIMYYSLSSSVQAPLIKRYKSKVGLCYIFEFSNWLRVAIWRRDEWDIKEKWSVFLEPPIVDNNRVIFSSNGNLLAYGFMMGSFLSFIMTRRDIGISNWNDLDEFRFYDISDTETSVFGVNDLGFQNRQPGKFPRVGMYVVKDKLEIALSKVKFRVSNITVLEGIEYDYVTLYNESLCTVSQANTVSIDIEKKTKEGFKIYTVSPWYIPRDKSGAIVSIRTSETTNIPKWIDDNFRETDIVDMFPGWRSDVLKESRPIFKQDLVRVSGHITNTEVLSPNASLAPFMRACRVLELNQGFDLIIMHDFLYGRYSDIEVFYPWDGTTADSKGHGNKIIPGIKMNNIKYHVANKLADLPGNMIIDDDVKKLAAGLMCMGIVCKSILVSPGSNPLDRVGMSQDQRFAPFCMTICFMREVVRPTDGELCEMQIKGESKRRKFTCGIRALGLEVDAELSSMTYVDIATDFKSGEQRLWYLTEEDMKADCASIVMKRRLIKKEIEKLRGYRKHAVIEYNEAIAKGLKPRYIQLDHQPVPLIIGRDSIIMSNAKRIAVHNNIVGQFSQYCDRRYGEAFGYFISDFMNNGRMDTFEPPAIQFHNPNKSKSISSNVAVELVKCDNQFSGFGSTVQAAFSIVHSINRLKNNKDDYDIPRMHFDPIIITIIYNYMKELDSLSWITELLKRLSLAD